MQPTLLNSALLRRFASQVLVQPCAVACQCERVRLTYEQLDQLSNQLAESLLARGLCPGDRVAICMPKSSYCVVAILAVVKARGVYLPLDPDYPEDRLQFIAQDSQPASILTSSDHNLSPAFAGIPSLIVDTVPAISSVDGNAQQQLETKSQDTTRPETSLHPTHSTIDDPAIYMIYTSGSTGRPKAVVVGERSTINFVDSMLAAPGFQPSDVLLSASTLAFDISVYDVFVPLSAGGRIVIVSREVARDGQLLSQAIASCEASIMFATPSSWRMLIDSGWQGDREHFRVFTGGEHLPRELIEPLLSRAGEVWNFYGPTEATVLVTRGRVLDPNERILVGEPIEQVQLTVVDDQLSAAPDEIAGELLISGTPLAHGYWNRPELESERFISFQGQRAYRTGDLCKRTSQGKIECLGRMDNQVKIRGHRIELGEIESVLSELPAVRQSIVVADQSLHHNTRLIGYVLLRSDVSATAAELLNQLQTKLPDYMVPSAIEILDAFPLTPNGKIDRLSLPQVSSQRPQLANDFVPPASELERQLAVQWAALLGLEQVGVTDNFFQLGGNSLLAVKAASSLTQILGRNCPVAILFDQPSIRQILQQLCPEASIGVSNSDVHLPCESAGVNSAPGSESSNEKSGYAIVGMAARFPGANNVQQFWQNLLDGVESIRFFQPEELAASIPIAERNAKNYVAARGVLEGVEDFDARFFGISPREAELIDPQQRILLELAFNALQDAGFTRDNNSKRVGVWAGCFANSYFTQNLLSNPDRLSEVSEFQLATCTEKDFIATRIAHHLDLLGPAINVNTACSTSLVAVIEACKSLQNGECELALAGGSTIIFPQHRGHAYQAGNILSSDGHCRPFDASADGTLFSDGAGLVVLKRYSDAVQDGDRIYAVIRGLGLNNDGGRKASFSAPSVQGQAAAIRMAHRSAGISADQIELIEAHGTATPLGDPIEVAALTEAFRDSTSRNQFCAIGSVKSNIGHCVAAAGIAGLIKAALSLYHQQIPGTVHYKTENPALNLSSSPFFVCDQLRSWPRQDQPRWAGVSSFGVGGTNAHVILSDGPVAPVTPESPWPIEIWPLSAHSANALQQLENSFRDLAEKLEPGFSSHFGNTLKFRREQFSHRSFVVFDSNQQAAASLQTKNKRSYGSNVASANKPGLTWMFPGQGSQYARMGKDLYRYSNVFRTWYDRSCELLKQLIGLDLRDLFEQSEEDQAANDRLQDTRITQPAIFALSYSLAQVWLSAGLRPDRLIGHSVGEFAAATLAGVFGFEDALRLIAKRGELVSQLPRGCMLSVLASSEQLEKILPQGCEIAAINAPRLCVVAGSQASIEELMLDLKSQDIACRLLLTSHAFHSSMMDSAVEPLEQFVSQLDRKAPSIPIHSTVTGLPLTDEQATSSRYWAEHLRKPVLFSQAIEAALASRSADQSETMLEIGPRATLVTLVKKQKPSNRLHLINSLSESTARFEELRTWLYATGELWSAGHPLDWAAIGAGRRSANSANNGWLPEYPFDRKRLFIEPAGIPAGSIANTDPASSVSAASNESSNVVTDYVLTTIENNSPVLNQINNDTTMSNSQLQQDSRVPQLIFLVRELFEDSSGIEIPAESAGCSYLELGFDSLMLTQISSAIQRKFDVEVTFRQLLEELSTADLLATWLDNHLPTDKFATTAPACSISANSSTAGTRELFQNDNTVEPQVQSAGQTVSIATNLAVQSPQPQSLHVDLQRAQLPITIGSLSDNSSPQSIVQQQLQLMQLQLQFLAGTSTVPVVTPPTSTPTSTSTPALSASLKAPTVPSSQIETSNTSAEPQKVFGAQARVSLQSAKVDAQVEQRLAEFIDKYNKHTPNSKAYAQRHRSKLADPRTVSGFQPATKEMTYPIVVERSKGAYLYDIDGHQYIDLVCGYGSNFFGHSPDFMVEALSKQLATGYEIGPQNALTGEVAELFCEVTGSERVAFCNTGSEAVLGALRVARTVTGRDKVVMFTGDYHGILDEVIVRPNKKQASFPAAPGIPGSAVQNMLVLEYGSEQALQTIASEIDNLAAVIVETVQSRRPDYQPREFLHKLRQLTQDKPTALIFDEVITGFRAGVRGAQGFYGVESDMATYGKVIGGGMPIGVIGGKTRYMDALDGGYWRFGDNSRPEVGMTYFAGTFVRHPLALAAAKQTLLYLKQSGQQAYQHLQDISDQLESGLLKVFSQTGAPLRIARFCSLLKPEFTQELPYGELLFAAARRRGLHVWEHRPWFLTLAHTHQDIDRVLAIMHDSILEAQSLGFLPGNKVTQEQKAKLGKDRNGNPGWFIPDTSNPGQFIQVRTLNS